MRADENVWTDEYCTDCGDPLRFGDDATCRWCDAHRVEHPEEYGWALDAGRAA